MTLDEFRALAERIGARADEVPAALERIGAAARDAGVADGQPRRRDDRRRAPRSARVARASANSRWPRRSGEDARAAGDWVVMGCPNVVRGGSHLGWASAARLAEAGICTVLSSDYFYPAMLRAALILAGRGVLDLPRAWALISANPAAAAGLTIAANIARGTRGGSCAGRSDGTARCRHHRRWPYRASHGGGCQAFVAGHGRMIDARGAQ